MKNGYKYPIYPNHTEGNMLLIYIREYLISIRINRVDYENNLTKEQKEHITEIDLDNINDFDYFIINNNNYDKLKIDILDILRSV